MRWPCPLLCAVFACAESTPLEPASGRDAGASLDATLLDAALLDAAEVTPDGTAPDAATPDALSLDAASLDAATAADGGLRYPLVFVHGLGASARSLGFARVLADLRARGVEAEAADLPPYDASEVRAVYLARAVDQVLLRGAGRVNLVAHSQGGLDARHLVSGLGYGDRVASLSTISTPHRGSYFADVALGLTGLSSTAALDALVGIFGGRISDLDADTQVRASLSSCAESSAAAFNAAHPDDPRVHYQSWAGLSNVLAIPSPDDLSACGRFLFDPAVRDRLDPLLLTTAGFVAHGLALRPNDGLVTVQSARWGDFRGCVPADHLDEIGEFADQPPNDSGFDFLAFYRALVEELAQRGF